MEEIQAPAQLTELQQANNEYAEACAQYGHELFKLSLTEEKIEGMKLKVFNLNQKIGKILEKQPKGAPNGTTNNQAPN